MRGCCTEPNASSKSKNVTWTVFNYFLGLLDPIIIWIEWIELDDINNINNTSVTRDQNFHQWWYSTNVTCLRHYHVTSKLPIPAVPLIKSSDFTSSKSSSSTILQITQSLQFKLNLNLKNIWFFKLLVKLLRTIL